MLAKLHLEVFPLAAVSLLKGGPGFDLDDAAMAREYERGFRQGYAEGLGEAAADAELFAAQLAESLRDLDLAIAEARASALRRLEPLFEAIFGVLAPDIASLTLPARLAEYLGELADTAMSMPVSVKVAPANAAAMAKLLSAAGRNFAVMADPQLPRHAAEVDWGDGIGRIDLDRVIVRCKAVVAEHFIPQTQGAELVPKR